MTPTAVRQMSFLIKLTTWHLTKFSICGMNDVQISLAFEVISKTYQQTPAFVAPTVLPNEVIFLKCMADIIKYPYLNNTSKSISFLATVINKMEVMNRYSLFVNSYFMT